MTEARNRGFGDFNEFVREVLNATISVRIKRMRRGCGTGRMAAGDRLDDAVRGGSGGGSCCRRDGSAALGRWRARSRARASSGPCGGGRFAGERLAREARAEAAASAWEADRDGSGVPAAAARGLRAG